MGNYSSTSYVNSRKYGGFTPEELSDFKQTFSKVQDQHGNLDKKKLVHTLEAEINEIEQIYQFFDFDETNYVDFYKFICGLALLRQSTLRNKASQIFNIYNFDKVSKNNLLDHQELRRFIKMVYSTLAVFKKENKPSDQEIDEKTQEFIAKYDTNHDGHISKEEFKAYFSKDPKVIEFLSINGLITLEDVDSSSKENNLGKGGDQMDLLFEDKDFANELALKDNEEDERNELRKAGIEHNLKPEDEMFLEDQNEGDQFMAVKPWMGAVKNSQPSNYKPTKGESNPPDDTLELEYVYGYRCHDCRNNLLYNSNGEVIYHTAGVGIVLDPKTNTQRFYLEHNDDILSIDVYKDLVVTGQIGAKPMLCMWDMNTMETKFVQKGLLKKGINKVCFSHDGKKIAASAIDDEHTIAVFDVEQILEDRLNPSKKKEISGLIASGKGPRADILDLKFSLDNNSVIAACNKEMHFISIDSGKKLLKTKKGLFGKNPTQPVMNIAFLGNEIITGMYNGDLWVWSGNQVTKPPVKAHKGSVTAIASVEDYSRIITGGVDGNIFLWDKTLKKPIQTLSIVEDKFIRSMNAKIRALSESKDGKNIVCGTRGSEIVEFQNKNIKEARVLMRGHFNNELWGLSTHPSQSTFYTVGEDNMLALWDIKSRTQLKSVKLDYPSKTIHCSPDEKFLAVGCKNGMVLIIDPQTLTTITSIKHKYEISLVKFSPKSDLLAVGIAPPVSEVKVYNITKNFQPQCTLKGSPSRILHMDFSENGEVIQLNNSSYEILYYDPFSGKQRTHGASENKDEPWSSWTLIIGWPVQGIWPPCSDGSDINSIDRNLKKDILVTGDDFGKVKLFKYPCVISQSMFNKYGGHSAHVTSVRFTAKNDYIISTGGGEKSIFQWKYIDTDLVKGEEYEEDIQEEEQQEEDKEMFEEEEEDEGDQFMAVKPYLGQIKQPSWYKPSKKDNADPDGSLDLKHAIGYRCFDDCRNTAKWTADGKIVFVAGSLGVVMDIEKEPFLQSFFKEHEEDVISMAVHPKGQIAATGQMAMRGKSKTIDLYVWDIETKEAFCNLNKFHRRQIDHVSFSPDGTKLLSIGMDDDHSLAIHDWQSQALIVTSNVDKGKVTGVAWRSGTEFVTIGVKHIKFWTLNGRNVVGKRGQGGSKDPLLCVCSVFNKYATGNSKGEITIWAGNSAGKSVKAHQGNVSCLYSKNDKLYSGGADGLVLEWNSSMSSPKEIVNISQLSKFNPEIRSLDIKDNGQMLVGTRGSEIYIQNQGNWKLVLQGHFNGELWGLACQPESHQCVTCGGDKTIRIWNMLDYKQKAFQILDNDVRAVDWAPNGKFIIAADVKGKIFLLNPNDLNIINQYQSIYRPNPKKRGDPWIQDVKISPDSTMAAFGAHGGNTRELEVISVSESSIGKKKKIRSNFTGALLHLDWSEDSSILMCNSAAYELLFFNAETGQMVYASATNDTTWATYTCTLGWYVQGIFPGVDGTDVNACARSNNQKFLVSGDDFSQVNLFKFPVIVMKQKNIHYRGHSSHVTNVRFSFDDNFVISTGGNDKTVLIWKTDFGQKDTLQTQTLMTEKEEQLEENDDEEDEIIEGDDEVIKSKVKKFGNDKYCKLDDEVQEKKHNLFEEEENQGDEFMAVKPWLGAIKQPTNYTKDNTQHKPPNVTLNLEYAFGIRVKDCRNNCKFLKNGNIVYMTAAIGVVLNMEENVQQFFQKHIDDITAIDVAPDGVTVATGEVGPKPNIFVWNANTMEEIHNIKGCILKGITNLAFSPSGKRLVAGAIDNDHHVAIIDVGGTTASVISVAKGGREVIVDLQMNSDDNFVTVGVKHFKVWNLQGQTLKGQKASKIPQLSLYCCIYNHNGDILVGLSDGSLQVWKGTSCIKPQVVLHSAQSKNKTKNKVLKGLDAICLNQNYIATGGKDKIIRIIDAKSYQEITKINAQEILQDSQSSKIRSLDFSADGKTLLVVTYGSEIYTISTSSSQITSSSKFQLDKAVMKGHYTPNKKWTNEAWGLAVFPDGDHYATCSDDGTLRIWSTSQRKQILCLETKLNTQNQKTKRDVKTKDLDDSVKGRACTVSPDGKQLAVGFKDGHVRIFTQEEDDFSHFQQEHCFKHAKEWISDLKYSPNQQFLAVGSHDNAIYNYDLDAQQPFRRPDKKMNKHSSYITHLDWSTDSCYLHSNCGAYELLFWDANQGKQLTSGASALRDEQWASWTCTLGWPVQGIWPQFADGTDINYVDRSNNKIPDGYHLLASADDFGKVKLFKYPCILKGSQFVEGVGHSSHVPCVKWNSTDQYLYSIGGEDQTVMQWTVLKN